MIENPSSSPDEFQKEFRSIHRLLGMIPAMLWVLNFRAWGIW